MEGEVGASHKRKRGVDDLAQDPLTSKKRHVDIRKRKNEDPVDTAAQQQQKRQKIEEIDPQNLVPVSLRLSHTLCRQFQLTGTEEAFLPLLLHELYRHLLAKKKNIRLSWQFIDCATDCAVILKNLSYTGFCAWLLGLSSKFAFPYAQHVEIANQLASIILKRYPKDFEDWLIACAVASDSTLKPINLQLKVEEIFADVLKQHAQAINQGQLTLALSLKKDSQCFKCGCTTVVEIRAQLRSSDEGMNSLYRCGNSKCGETWKR